jgi:phosphomannomutase
MNPLNNSIKFGTDGWRAIIAEDFTFNNVRICAQAVAQHFRQNNLDGNGILVGYDTRFASADFARATAEVLASNGIKVYLCPKATPTPVISYGVTANKNGGAIIITASHNPPKWNGFKVKSPDGASAPTETIKLIEDIIETTHRVTCMPLQVALEKGMVTYLDLVPSYTRQMASLVDLEALRNASINIINDPMFGCGAGYFNMLIGGGKTCVREINSLPNPNFPGIKQPEPIAPNLLRLSAKVKEEKADIGIATDGDSDRIGIMDEHGNFLTQLQVYALLALYLLEIRGERGAIIKSLTTSGMIYKLGKLYNVPVYETSVGFKHIAPLMIKHNALIGGEESGGYGFRGHVPERDAILAGLYFLDFMVKTGKKPSELLKLLYDKVGEHHYERIDLDFDNLKREAIIKRLEKTSPDSINGVRVVRKDTIDGFRFLMDDDSWLLVRLSGTEPLLRIYAESSSPQNVTNLLAKGKEIAGI